MSQEIRSILQKSVNSMANEHWGYFCYEDTWCDSADQKSEPCDCEDCIEGFECKCGNCEAHYGSLLDVDITRGTDGKLRGVIAIVGVGGPRIELDTRQQQVIGYWGNEEVRSRVDAETCRQVEQYFDDLGM